mgnify:CR=1 FL=1
MSSPRLYIDELAITSHHTARSVILLAPDSEDPDAEVIKTLLALTHGSDEGGPRIVAEIRDPGNLEAARLVGASRTTLLDIIQLFETIDPIRNGDREDGDDTAEGQALCQVLMEIEDTARATFSSITLDTMIKLVDRGR